MELNQQLQQNDVVWDIWLLLWSPFNFINEWSANPLYFAYDMVVVALVVVSVVVVIKLVKDTRAKRPAKV